MVGSVGKKRALERPRRLLKIIKGSPPRILAQHVCVCVYVGLRTLPRISVRERFRYEDRKEQLANDADESNLDDKRKISLSTQTSLIVI